MPFSLVSRMSSGALVALCGAIVLAGCQSDGAATTTADAAQPEVTVEELRAFCPRVELIDAEAILNIHEGGGDGDASRLVRQISLAEVTRSCSYGPGTMTVNVAAAGRIVPGPRGSGGAVTVPIRVEARRGSEVLYSQVTNQQVQVADTAGATQFIFNDPNVVLDQAGVQQVRVFVGIDR